MPSQTIQTEPLLSLNVEQSEDTDNEVKLVDEKANLVDVKETGFKSHVDDEYLEDKDSSGIEADCSSTDSSSSDADSSSKADSSNPEADTSGIRADSTNSEADSSSIRADSTNSRYDSSRTRADSTNPEAGSTSLCEKLEETEVSSINNEDSHLDYDADVDLTHHQEPGTRDYHDELPQQIDSQGCKDTLSMVKETISKSWKLFGLEFAPIILPLERRLQTLAVFVWIWSIIFLGALSTILLVYMVLYTNYWWLAIAYFTWMIVDRKAAEQGGRSERIKTWVRGWSLWKHYANYFPIRLVKTVDLDPKFNYLFGSHPHGILSSGAFGSLATDGANADKIFEGFKVNVHTLALNFWFPINREWILGLGGVNASRESISYLLSKPGGHISVIVVGGAAESMYTSHSQISLVLKKRKGFVKMALKHGAQLVPTFSFGEADVYSVLDLPEGSWIKALQEKFRHVVGFAPVLFFGRGVFNYNLGMIPHRRPITVVTGAPISIKKTPNPSVEEVEAVHAEYMEGLVDLYNKYNPVYGDERIKLNII